MQRGEPRCGESLAPGRAGGAAENERQVSRVVHVVELGRPLFGAGASRAPPEHSAVELEDAPRAKSRVFGAFLDVQVHLTGTFSCLHLRRTRTEGGVAVKEFFFARGIGKIREIGDNVLEELTACGR